jgi:hypothetical protein
MTNELKPCPFCGVNLALARGYFVHPKSDCYVSELKVSARSERDIAAWNRRGATAIVASEGRPIESIADELSTARGHHLDDERDPVPTGHWWTFDRDALADFAKRVANPSTEIAALRERIAKQDVDIAENDALIDSLRERIAGMEKDAERYRWLRGEGFDRPAHMWVTTLPAGTPIVNSDLDAAIDAAIAKEPK